ncbi:hypothetical protein GCM10009540_80900 [Streptomyces turgidiscabies]
MLGTSGVEFDAVDNGTAGSCGLRDGAASGRRLQHLTTGFEFRQVQELFDKGLRCGEVPAVDVGDHFPGGEQSREGVGSGEGEDVGALIAVPSAADRLKGQVYAVVQFAVERALEAESQAVDRGGADDLENVGIHLHGYGLTRWRSWPRRRGAPLRARPGGP